MRTQVRLRLISLVNGRMKEFVSLDDALREMECHTEPCQLVAVSMEETEFHVRNTRLEYLPPDEVNPLAETIGWSDHSIPNFIEDEAGGLVTCDHAYEQTYDATPVRAATNAECARTVF